MNTKLNVKKYFFVALIIILLSFFHYAKLLDPLESILGRVLAPVAQGFYSLGSDLGGIFKTQADSRILETNLTKAQAEIVRLTAENAELKFLEDENSALREYSKFFKSAGGRFLMANIVSRGKLTGDTGDSQSIIIDKGARDGLFSGLAVVSSIANGTSTQGVIIGKVVNVKDNLSEIYLVTNKNCKLAAAILGENKTTGIAHGELGLTVLMDFIPQTENIKIGDLVATSGLEENIKRGLVIGRVSEVNKENNRVWQSAAIEPLINLENLTMVAILLP